MDNCEKINEYPFIYKHEIRISLFLIVYNIEMQRNSIFANGMRNIIQVQIFVLNEKQK
jgi:hypothetical protein